jgi:hypothetical protein
MSTSQLQLCHSTNRSSCQPTILSISNRPLVVLMSCQSVSFVSAHSRGKLQQCWVCLLPGECCRWPSVAPFWSLLATLTRWMVRHAAADYSWPESFLPHPWGPEETSRRPRRFCHSDASAVSPLSEDVSNLQHKGSALSNGQSPH